VDASNVPDASAANSDPTYTLASGDCFTFATASSKPSGGQFCGDMLAVGVDLESAGGGWGGTSGNGFCDLPGTYASLSAIPNTYASCAWSQYAEVNLGPPTGHGLIVRDSTATHHYRVRIVSAVGKLVFSFDAID
jgi:hypothetical protein